MPLFRRRKQLDNAPAIPIQPLPPFPPETTIIHHHGYSRAAVIFSLFVVAVIGAFLGWHALVFLAGQVGFDRPAQAAAYCLGIVGLILALVGSLGALGRFFLNDLLAHRERMADKLVSLEQARARTAQLIPPTTQARMTREESRQYLAVKLVMDKAYQMIDPSGNLYGKVEPWSRRSVGLMRLINEPGEIGENSKLAAWVKQYLLDRRILLGDRQVNVRDFPNLATVETQLVKDFGQPIIFRANGDAGMSTHYLERGTGRESWGG